MFIARIRLVRTRIYCYYMSNKIAVQQAELRNIAWYPY